MMYSNCITVLILGVVDFFIFVSPSTTECIHVDFPDAGGVRECVQNQVKLPAVQRLAAIYGSLSHPVVQNEIAHIDKNAFQCQPLFTFFNDMLPILLACTINSEQWSWKGESVLVMEEVFLRLVMELNSSRVDDVEELLKNFDNEQRSLFNCTSYPHDINRELAQCFVPASCHEDLSSMFLCLINQALDHLDPIRKKGLACELFEKMSYPFLLESLSELTVILKEINALCS